MCFEEFLVVKQVNPFSDGGIDSTVHKVRPVVRMIS